MRGMGMLGRHLGGAQVFSDCGEETNSTFPTGIRNFVAEREGWDRAGRQVHGRTDRNIALCRAVTCHKEYEALMET
jgi:hypothetical protein